VASPTANPAVFVITRKGPTDFDLPVFYTLGGTAENGVDYARLPGRILIPKGSSAVRVAVMPLADALKEGAETVSIRVDPPVCIEIFPQPKECYRVAEPSAAKAEILDHAPVIPDNLPPRVMISSPTSGQVFRASSDIEVTAVAVDADGYAARAELYAGQEKVAVSEPVFIQPPAPGSPLKHSFLWKAVPAGIYELVVAAYDDDGAATKSAPVRIQVLETPRLPVVTIIAADAEAAEPPTPLPNQRIAINRGLFHISRTGPTLAELKVYYSLTGTAQNGIDYQRIAPPAVIPAGAETAIVEVLPINDQVLEPTETISATLIQPRIGLPGDPVVLPAEDGTLLIDPVIVEPTYTIGLPSTAGVRILDNGEGPSNEIPIVTVAKVDAKAVEPPTNDPAVDLETDNGRFTIKRTGSTDRALDVYFRVAGSALPGVDYHNFGNKATIPPGASSVDIEVIPLFDRLAESEESVVLGLVPWLIAPEPVNNDPTVILPRQPIRPAYRVGQPAEAKVVILDTPPAQNRPPKIAIVKPESGSSFPAGQAITLTAQTADSDGYVPWVEFFSGRTKIGDSRIDFIRPPEPGALITHTFGWKGAPVGLHELFAIAHDDGGASTRTEPAVVIKVTETTERTVVMVEAVDASGAEPDPVPPGMGRPTILDPLVFVFRRKGDLSVPITVRYHFEGSATPGRDFEVSSRVIEFPAGSEATRLMLTPIDDDLVEGEETVAVIIDPVSCIAIANPPPTCYIVGEPGAAKGVIRDNDPNESVRPTVTLFAADATATEGSSEWTTPTATFVVSRTGPVTASLTVFLKSGGTAIPGKDYEALPEKIELAPGQSSARLVVKALGDSEVEPIETVLLELLPPQNAIRPLGWPSYELGRPSKAVPVILDNDRSRPPCLRLPDGRFHICLPARDGTRYRILSSSDLKNWSDRGPAEANEGSVHYVDPELNQNSGAIFYRLEPEQALSLEAAN